MRPLSATLIVGLVAVVALGGLSMPAQADVTGAFKSTITVLPQTAAAEAGPLRFDLQGALDITVALSGLRSTVHSHLGLAGVEDVTIRYAASLGAFEFQGDLVFARFAGTCLIAFDAGCERIQPNPVPQSSGKLRFLKKRVETRASLAGVTIRNLAMIEDTVTNGFVCEACGRRLGSGFERFDLVLGGTLAPTGVLRSEWASRSAVAFGDVFSMTGQTPSGITVGAEIGICAERHPNVAKGHSWPYRVNPHCAGVEVGLDEVRTLRPLAKPDLLFDFERFRVAGVPLGSGLTADTEAVCERTLECRLSATVRHAGPVPIRATFNVEDLFGFELGDATLAVDTGLGTLEFFFANAARLAFVTADLEAALNPSTNPATLGFSGALVPGGGLLFTDVSLEVPRGGLTLTVDARFVNDDLVRPAPGASPAELTRVSFGLATAFGPFELEAENAWNLAGLREMRVEMGMAF